MGLSILLYLLDEKNFSDVDRSVASPFISDKDRNWRLLHDKLEKDRNWRLLDI